VNNDPACVAGAGPGCCATDLDAMATAMTIAQRQALNHRESMMIES
jgi:hypothetical protein